MLNTSRGSHVYLMLTPTLVLIDTSFGFTGKHNQALGITPADIRHILVTHHDLDHIGNAVMLQKATGATVWASAEDVPYITGDKQRTVSRST